MIQPNPVGKLAIDPSSNLCANGNRVCLKDASTKGAADIEKIIVLWFDGSTSKTQKPLGLMCRSFSGAGTYSYNLEVADAFGCKHNSTATVTINPSPKIQGKYSSIPYCDSVQFCFDGLTNGGTTGITYEWYNNPGKSVISTSNVICKTYKAGEYGSFKCKVTNSFGCPDSFYFYGSAPVRKIVAKISGRKFCKKDMTPSNAFFASNEFLNWYINGKLMGTYDTLPLKMISHGWNYVKGEQLPPCKGVVYDSFYVTDVTASGIAFNNVRAKVIDTVFFLDVGSYSPGTKIYRLWSFNDDEADSCTTSIKQNLNPWQNCNYSYDSLARHYYHKKKCFEANLYVYDSVSGCYDDTTIEVYRYDYCNELISPEIVCLGDPVIFSMTKAAYYKAGTLNFLYTDTGNPRNVYTLKPSPVLFYTYSSVGYKSPIFKRFYYDEIVWKDSAGKIVIDSMRKDGWVSDTFFNGVLVKYRPNASFSLVKPGLCPPWKTTLKFMASTWEDPDTMVVNWGDTIEYFTNYSGKLGYLDSLKHQYKKPGIYDISVKLKPKQGCTNEYFGFLGIGTHMNFTPELNCNWRRVKFNESVKMYGDTNEIQTDSNELFWDFGNGTYGVGSDPIAKYSKTGTYKVTLKYLKKGGCSDSFSRDITLSGPVAAMKNAPIIYCSELHTFYDSSYMSGVTNGDFITKRIWNFGDGTADLFGTSISHIYPTGGTYVIRLVVQTNKGCSDTIYQSLKVLGPEVYAKIGTDSSGCPPLYIRFDNYSKQCGNYIWQFGDPMNNIYSTHADTSVSFTYTKPGVYFAKLIGGDSFFNPNTGNRYFCSATYPKTGDSALMIVVYPNAITDFEMPDSVCPKMTFEIKNTSPVPVKEYTWKLPNYTQNNIPFGSIYYRFEDTGTYAIGAFPQLDTSYKFCPDSAWKKLKVVQHFTSFVHDCKKSHAPAIHFKNTSVPQSDIYRWTEMNPVDSSQKDLAYSRDINLQYNLDTGKHIVCLNTTDSAYCYYRSCTTLIVKNYLAIANVFTPGTDGFNDVYKVPFDGYQDFEMKIFNRYGERIFYTTNPKIYWNGKVENKGAELPSGTYFYQITFKEECHKEKTMINGSVNLLR